MPIEVEEAMRRIDAIHPLLYADIWTATRTLRLMDSANEMLRELDFTTQQSPTSGTFNLVFNSVQIRLAFDLARIYDLTKDQPMDKQGKASIPILAHYLDRPDVRAELLTRARARSNDGQLGENTFTNAIERAVRIRSIMSAEPVKAALHTLRDFRTARLAHHLYDKLPETPPTFDQLYLLTNTATTFAEASAYAVEGVERDLHEMADSKRMLDDAYWRVSLSALKEHALKAAEHEN